MKVIIDTSIIIAAEKNVISFSSLQEYGITYISSITITELILGVYNANTEARKEIRSVFIEYVITLIPNLPFGEAEARIYAKIMHILPKGGITIGTHNLMIGATAIANDCAILTLNEKDFIRIPELKVIAANS